MTSSDSPYRSIKFRELGATDRAVVALRGFTLDVLSPRVSAAKLMLEVPNLSPLQKAKAVDRISKSGTIDDCFALFSRDLSNDLQNLVATSLVAKIKKEFDSKMSDATSSESGAAGYFGMKDADRFLADQKSKVRTLLHSENVTSDVAQKTLSDFISTK